MTIVEDAADTIESNFPNYGIILKNGIILRSTLENDSIIKVFPIVSSILKQLPIKFMYVKNPVFIFRLTENVIIIILSNSHENLVSQFLNRFYDIFHEKFADMYKKIPNTLEDYMQFSIFSIARNAGPEPFAWLSKSKDISDERIFKYSITSMMLLMDELGGANKRILNFHPYVGQHILGVIYLFQIPLGSARGGAFDCSLMVSVDYSERALLYQVHYELEKIFSMTADEIITAFKNRFKDDIQRPISRNDREFFTKYLEKLIKRLNSIPIKIKPSNIKEEMVNSIKALSEYLN